MGKGTFLIASINSILSINPSFLLSIKENNKFISFLEKLNFSKDKTFSNSSNEITFSNLKISYDNKTSKYSEIKSILY